MKKDVIKYIAILIAIIFVVWILMINDNNFSSPAIEETETESISLD